MKVLISSIGTRGEVQPIVALALQLRTLGHEPALCLPPNFKPWVESFGLTCIPVGPDVQKFASRLADPKAKQSKPSRAQWRKIIGHTVGEQFQVLGAAARGCDLLVACGGLQSAARSVAETEKIPYVYVAYCAGTLPSPAHPPPMIRSQSWPALANRLLWKKSEWSWNSLFRAAVNEQRAALGLGRVESVPQYIFTDEPWLAADPVLGPAAPAAGLRVTQPGAWLLPDPAPLPESLERFLAAGEPPLYFGFGSMQAGPDTSRLLVETARALGRRAIISQGWGNLSVVDGGEDCIAIGDVSHAQLFPRVAAIVHHGGAGTTTTAARAGRPQVVVPHLYDQHYWAERVRRLGAGVVGPAAKRLDGAALRAALRACLRPEIAKGAAALASRIEPNGARRTAELLTSRFA